MTITMPLGRDDCESLCVNCTNCSNRESMAAGDRWQSNAFLFQAAAVTLGLLCICCWIGFSIILRKHWVCNYQLMRIFIFCSNGFPYFFAPVFSTPEISTSAVFSCNFHSCIFHSRVFSAPIHSLRQHQQCRWRHRLWCLMCRRWQRQRRCPWWWRRQNPRWKAGTTICEHLWWRSVFFVRSRRKTRLSGRHPRKCGDYTLFVRTQ